MPARGGETMRQRCPLPMGHEHVDDAGRVVLRIVLEVEALVRVERRQVVERDLLAHGLGRRAVELLDLEQREVALGVLGRSDLPFDGVAGAQAEAADLRRRDVDVVGAGQVVVVGGAQEAEAVGEGLEDAVAVDLALVGGGVLQQREDEVLAAHAADAFEFSSEPMWMSSPIFLRFNSVRFIAVSPGAGARRLTLAEGGRLSIGGKYGLLVRFAENARRCADSCQGKWRCSGG